MMNFKKTLALFSFTSVVLGSTLAFAQSGVNETRNNDKNMKAPQGTTINQGARSGNNSQWIGVAANAVVAGYNWSKFYATCSASGGCNYWYAAMATMSTMQALADRSAAGQSMNVADSSWAPEDYAFGQEGFPESLSDVEFDKGTGLDGLNGSLQQYQANMKGLGDSGASINEKGLSIGEKTIPFDQLNSKAGMMAAGATDAEAQSLIDFAKKTSDAFASKLGDTGPNVVSMGVNSGPGGARGPASSSDDGMEDYFAALKRQMLGPEQRKQIIAGKSISLGNESIGVKGDNIFDMIQRRYQVKKRSDIFVKK